MNRYPDLMHVFDAKRLRIVTSLVMVVVVVVEVVVAEVVVAVVEAAVVASQVAYLQGSPK